MVYRILIWKTELTAKDDESLYQPKIHSQRVKTLYNLKEATGKPMTVLLDQAISDLASNYGIVYQFEEEPVLEKVDQETWEDVIAGRKKENQFTPERIDIALNLPQNLLRGLYTHKFGVRSAEL